MNNAAQTLREFGFLYRFKSYLNTCFKGICIFRHLFEKHEGENKSKSSDLKKTEGSLYKRKEKNDELNIMVGSGEYQRSILPLGLDDNPRSREPDTMKPKEGLLKTGWRYSDVKNENNVLDDNTTSFPVIPGVTTESFRPRDEHVGAHTRVSVMDGGALTAPTVPVVSADDIFPTLHTTHSVPPALPPITEVVVPESTGESFQKFGLSVDINY